MSVSFPPEHLSFHTDMAGSMKKDVLDWSSEITEGWGGVVGFRPGHTRDLGHEVLTGCGGKRTKQILSQVHLSLFYSCQPCSPPTAPPPPHTQPAPRLGGSALGHRD